MAYKFCSISKTFRSRFPGPTETGRQASESSEYLPPHDDPLNSRQGQPVIRKCFPSVVLTSLSSSWCRFCRLARFSALKTCVTWRKTGPEFNSMSPPPRSLILSILTAWQPSPLSLSGRVCSLQPRTRLGCGWVVWQSSHPNSQRRDTGFSL